MKFPYTSSSANICSSKTPCSSNPLFLYASSTLLQNILIFFGLLVIGRSAYIKASVYHDGNTSHQVRTFLFYSLYLWKVLKELFPLIFAHFTTASCIILTFTCGHFHTVIHAVNCRCKKNI